MKLMFLHQYKKAKFNCFSSQQERALCNTPRRRCRKPLDPALGRHDRSCLLTIVSALVCRRPLIAYGRPFQSESLKHLDLERMHASLQFCSRAAGHGHGSREDSSVGKWVNLVRG